jgi:hypothetical protein
MRSDKIQWPSPFPLPFSFIQPCSQRAPHPGVLEKDIAYISGADMFRIRVDGSTGILFLDHKLLDHVTFRRRAVCIIPNELLKYLSQEAQLFLIWPYSPGGKVVDYDGEVKVLVLPTDPDRMTLIMTGIKSEDLVEHGVEWFVPSSFSG